MSKNISIALDLDCTLAFYESKWKAQKVGEPIWAMVDQVKKWLSKGHRVTIFTARLDRPNNSEDLENQIRMIRAFLRLCGLDNLEMTAIKRREFTHFIDDKAYHCIKNAGIIPNIPEELQ